MIDLINISKNYKDKIVIKNFSYHFEKNGLYFLVGKSGCGKTTLLNIISGVIKPTCGIVKYSDIDSIYRDSYYIFQDFNLDSDLTVIDNIKFVIKLKKQEIDSNKINEVLSKIGILELANKKCSNISGGERQRVLISIALILNSKVLLLDEPTASLDEENSKNIINLLREISNDVLVIVSTHDRNFINDKDNQINMENPISMDCLNENVINKQKRINLGLNIFYIKNKLLLKQYIHSFFQIIILSCLIISSSFIIPISRISKTSLYSKSIIENDQIVYIDDNKHIFDSSSYNKCINMYDDIELKYEDKKIIVNNVYIDNTLKDNEIIITSDISKNLGTNSYIYISDSKIDIVSVKNSVFTSRSNDINLSFIMINSTNYVKLNKNDKDLWVGASVYHTDFNLSKNEFIASKHSYDTSLNSYKIGDSIVLNFGKGIQKTVKLVGIDQDNSYLSSELKNEISYELIQYNELSNNNYIITNLSDYSVVSKLVNDCLKNENDMLNLYAYNLKNSYYAANFFESFKGLLNVFIPLLIIVGLIISIYVSYNLIHNSRRSLASIRMLGVSKFSIFNMYNINNIEILLISLILSILPIIKINEQFINELTNLFGDGKYLSIFEIKYFLMSGILIFIIMSIINLIQILLYNKKNTYIN